MVTRQCRLKTAKKVKSKFHFYEFIIILSAHLFRQIYQNVRNVWRFIRCFDILIQMDSLYRRSWNLSRQPSQRRMLRKQTWKGGKPLFDWMDFFAWFFFVSFKFIFKFLTFSVRFRITAWSAWIMEQCSFSAVIIINQVSIKQEFGC